MDGDAEAVNYLSEKPIPTYMGQNDIGGCHSTAV